MKPTLSIVTDANPEPRQTTIEAKLTASRLLDAAPRSSIWEPVSGSAPSTSTHPVPIPIEGELVATILQPLASGESHRVHNDRKERELLALLELLTAVEALTLHRRLTSARAGDALVHAFGRLVVERRNRVLAFLADTRRRIALRRA